MTGPHAAPRLFVGVHRSKALPYGPLIDLATRARFAGISAVRGFRWEFPDGPATHAFVVADNGDDTRPRWRLDAQPPAAAHSTYSRPDVPTRVWECTGDVAAGIARARSLIGTPYDMMELGNQGVAVVAEPLRALGFGFPVDYASLEPGRICTTLTALVMRACGGTTAAIGAAIEDADAFPTEVARRCAGALREVDPVTLEPMPAVRAGRVHAVGCPRERCECGAEVGR